MRRKMWPVRTSVCLPWDVYGAIKLLSKQNDVPMSQIIRETITRSLLSNVSELEISSKIFTSGDSHANSR